MRYAVFAVVVSLLAIGQDARAADQPAFTGSGKSCSDITWQPDVLTRFPNIGVVCQGIVEQNGKLYARFNGVVQRRSGSALYIRFQGGENAPGGDHAVLIDPPGDMVIQTAKGKFRVREAQRGWDRQSPMAEQRDQEFETLASRTGAPIARSAWPCCTASAAHRIDRASPGSPS